MSAIARTLIHLAHRFRAELPVIIQGGMGVAVSGWRLAKAVAKRGQLGVVSGTALDVVLARRLQRGDPGGHARRALATFPIPAIAQRLLKRFFVPGGIPAEQPYRPVDRLALTSRTQASELAVAGNYVEVFLAKEGHHGPVGINYLEKIQLALPAAAYGAMLAGVDYVLVGAGLPTQVPRLLDLLALHQPVQIPVHVAGAPATKRYAARIDPATLGRQPLPPLRRPRLLAIVSSAALAAYLAREPATRPDGFVIESPIAGGHSARPRGKMTLSGDGEPVYGPRDDLNLDAAAGVGLPFWVAGGFASPEQLKVARSYGAAGIQVGSAFALSRESGMDTDLRRRLIAAAENGTLTVRNDAIASPTGFPFKIAYVSGTVAEEETFARRSRRCDLGYLRTPYWRDGRAADGFGQDSNQDDDGDGGEGRDGGDGDGRIGYRCAAEPVEAYVRKGGSAGDTKGVRCLCNGLLATVGLGQRRRDGYDEAPLVTIGQDLTFLPHLRRDEHGEYGADDVIDYLLSRA